MINTPRWIKYTFGKIKSPGCNKYNFSKLYSFNSPGCIKSPESIKHNFSKLYSFNSPGCIKVMFFPELPSMVVIIFKNVWLEKQKHWRNSMSNTTAVVYFGVVAYPCYHLTKLPKVGICATIRQSSTFTIIYSIF